MNNTPKIRKVVSEFMKNFHFLLLSRANGLKDISAVCFASTIQPSTMNSDRPYYFKLENYSNCLIFQHLKLLTTSYPSIPKLSDNLVISFENFSSSMVNKNRQLTTKAVSRGSIFIGIVVSGSNEFVRMPCRFVQFYFGFGSILHNSMLAAFRPTHTETFINSLFIDWLCDVCFVARHKCPSHYTLQWCSW